MCGLIFVVLNFEEEKLQRVIFLSLIHAAFAALSLLDSWEFSRVSNIFTALSPLSTVLNSNLESEPAWKQSAFADPSRKASRKKPKP